MTHPDFHGEHGLRLRFDEMGSFAAAVGKMARAHDSGAQFIRALGEALGCADTNNTTLLLAYFGDLRYVMDTDAASRYQLLREAMAHLWEDAHA